MRPRPEQQQQSLHSHDVVLNMQCVDFLKWPCFFPVFSSTKCLPYPFPVSRPITWRYYLRESRPVRFQMRTHGHIKSKLENTSVNLIIHLYVKSELCLKIWSRGMSKSRKSRPKRTQMRPKRTPESFQDERCDQRDPEKVARRGPKAPEAPQRPTRAEKYEKPIGF